MHGHPDESPDRGVQAPRVVAATALLFLALVYLALKSVFYREPDADFRLFWTAGHLWAWGINPYSEQFTSIGRVLFPNGNQITLWYYPPQWWIILRPLASLPADSALSVWRAGNALLVPLSALALVRALPRAGIAIPGWATILFVALPAFMEATPTTLALGQSSILIFAGYCLYARGLILSHRSTLALGLFLLLLKPQIGIPATMAVLILPRCWSAVAIAGAATVAASLPQVATHGTMATVHDLLANLVKYRGMGSDLPIEMTGLNQILARLLDRDISTGLAILLCAAASVAATLALRRRGDSEEREGAAIALAHIALVAFFVPLHGYDFIAVAPVAILAMAFGWQTRAAAWLGMALCLRPGLLARLLDPSATSSSLQHPLVPLIVTIAGLLVLLSAALIWREPVRNYRIGPSARPWTNWST